MKGIMNLKINNKQLNEVDFNHYLTKKIIHTQRLRCLSMGSIYLLVSIAFIFFGTKQVLPVGLLAENWGLPNYVWVVVISIAVGTYEYINFLILNRNNLSLTYLKLSPYFILFLEAIHPTMIIWLLSHSIPVKASLESPPIFFYSVVIILSTLHINPMLCIFTGAVAGFSFFGLALMLSQIASLPVSVAAIKAAFFIIIGVVAAIVTHEIKKNILTSKSLATQKEEADEANLSKSKFLAAASHDLRQPLHALTLFTSVLDKRIKGKDERDIINNIKRSVASLESLLNSLLDISKLDANTVQVDKQDFKISFLLNQLSAEYLPQAKNKGLHWSCESCDYMVRSDPVLLETILRNLMSNAIRYTQKGEVSVECYADNLNVIIEVKDTGVGIAEDQQNIIFQEFEQLENAAEENKGMGLGLSIVDRLSRLLDHAIEIKSKPGAGSCFIVTLPLSKASHCSLEEPKDSPAYETNLTDVLVLVIDDEKSIREGMKALINDWGYRVILASSEAQAIKKLSAHRCPDVIISDLSLGNGLTGIQAIQSIRKIFDHHIPAIIVSGDTSVNKLNEVQQSGLSLLHKPVPPARLHAFIKRMAREKLMRVVM